MQRQEGVLPASADSKDDYFRSCGMAREDDEWRRAGERRRHYIIIEQK